MATSLSPVLQFLRNVVEELALEGRKGGLHPEDPLRAPLPNEVFNRVCCIVTVISVIDYILIILQLNANSLL